MAKLDAMKVGILGSGIVGRVLASAFLNEGHEVLLGTRNTSKDEVVNWKAANPGGQTGDFSAAAKFGQLLVLCTAGSVAENVVDLAGPENFKGKTVIDTCNPLAKEPPDHGVLKFFTSLDHSLMERFQAKLPGAKFVKAFNCVGNAKMYKPGFKNGPPTMFICGNDNDAKKEVTAILRSFGWEAEDMGTVEAARAIEPLCMLWCIPLFLRNETTHAFKLLKK